VSRESKILIGVLVVIIGGLIGLFVAMNSGADTPGKATDPAALIQKDSHKQGAGSVQLVEFGDYQCPACGKAYPIVKQLQKDYDGKLTFYFRNYPLTQLHPNAMAAANAAEQAADLGKFWEMHDKLYESQADWSELSASAAADKFADYAKGLGIDGNKVKQAATDSLFKDRIAQDVADGDAQKVQATPTFFVNGKAIETNDYASIKAAIDAALKG
jgi:protein-disulfide isomerase